MTSTDTHASFRSSPPQPGHIGAEIWLEDPLAIDAESADAIRALVYEHKLVVFRDIELGAPDYVRFAQQFGTPQIYFQHNYHHPDHPEIFVSSNRPMRGEKVGVAGTGRYWHTDYQFFDEPLPMTMVYPQQLPSANRETFYIDMERAWADMPTELREALAGRRCKHEAKWRYKVQPCDVDKSITELLEEFGALTPTVTHPSVLRHPVNDRELLYVSEGFTVGVDGLGVEEGRSLLTRVNAFVQQERHVHTHPWKDGDILFWDNRQVIHKASETPPGEPSVSFRIGVYDGQPFYTNR